MDQLVRDLYTIFEDLDYTVGFVDCSEGDNVFVVYFDMENTMNESQLFPKMEKDLRKHGFELF